MHARNRLGKGILACGLALATGVAMAAEPMSAGDCFLAGIKANNAGRPPRGGLPVSTRHGHSGALYVSADGLVGDDTPLVTSVNRMLVKTTETTPTTWLPGQTRVLAAPG
jgi:hypothetical protein